MHGAGLRIGIMDKELARHVARETLGGWKSLTDLVPLLKQNCSADEYEIYKKAIGKISGDISTEILGTVFKAYPDLEKEMESNRQKYGAVF